MKTEQHFDIAIIGAGFSGSLTALGLHRIGYHVVLIEKTSHPRFTIGESSTPIADLILRDLSVRYGLPWLNNISRYGSWQQTYPDVACGLKRGFSYYKHHPGQPFKTNSSHQNELLVAASANDRQSDTHWYRSDVDAFFVNKVNETGITYWDNTRVLNIQHSGDLWKVKIRHAGENGSFKTRWLIDATGGSSILNMLGVSVSSDPFRTKSSAIFTHFKEVVPWQSFLQQNNVSTADYPYNPDHSALHHLLDEGWFWMLRFNNGITSAGLVFNHRKNQELPKQKGKLWSTVINKYQSLLSLFDDAKVAASSGRFIQTGRLQHRAERAAGHRWVTLPHTAGFIDPLHSTGIAHSLSGVERILHAFEAKKSSVIAQKLKEYEHDIFHELNFIDQLVDGCYAGMDHFELFNIYSMLYFTAAIHYEQKRIGGRFNVDKDLFLSAGNEDIRQFTNRFYREIRAMGGQKSIDPEKVYELRKEISEAIEPYNVAGLLNSEVPNMYHHTAAEF